MPGTIRISVLEAVELPETFSDGTSVEHVTAKVTLGTRQFKTESRIVNDKRIGSWNSNFVFLVTNLRDKLVVAICDNEDHCLTQTCIEVPSIIEKGSQDGFVELKGGGRIHLSMSFILTNEERKKIQGMRLAVLKRREEERVKKTIIFRNVQPYAENDLEAASASAVTITEIDGSADGEIKDLKETTTGRLGFGSTMKPLMRVLMFDYARAVGLQSRQECKRIAKKTKFLAAENEHFEYAVPANVLDEDNRSIEGRRLLSVLDSEPAAVVTSSCKQSFVSGDMRKVDFKGGTLHVNLNNLTQRSDGQQGVRPVNFGKESPQLELPFGLGPGRDARLGPGARWAQKIGLDSRWTSPQKARRFVRVEWNSKVSAPRTSFLKVIKAAGSSHEAYGDDRSLQERHNLSNSIGAVLNKVVGGATILLAALFMMWPLSENATASHFCHLVRLCLSHH
ncbi:hypothetical protein KC19_VG026200 [Ceratodon purpureus]|uniref:C2 domain-containing protein n=1 Tax=Ceratodon purpureus TaxID=3225 RepID=A0A8T0HLI8_CERPU|nr:hypothetical protein KC19_VG026200 [Ceratodon purpureus]